MGKIDDVAELLTNEIKSFKKTIKHIEDVSKTLDNTTIKTDIAHLKGIVQTTNEHQLVMASNNNSAIKTLVDSILLKLEYPKWIIQIGIFVWFFFLIIFGYTVYELKNINTLEIRAYEEGKANRDQHFSNFIYNNPEVKKLYEDWINKREDEE